MGHSVDLLDLSAFNFPIFEERLKFMKDPSTAVLDYAERFRKAEGVIVVTRSTTVAFPPASRM
ncbi:MAG: hypothetical protein R2818_12350 [Flavobacteriales bacterium]